MQYSLKQLQVRNACLFLHQRKKITQTIETIQASFVKFNPISPPVGKYNLSEIKYNSRLKTAPSVSLPKAKRYDSEKKVVPGPGAYQIQKQKEKSQKGVSFKGTHQFNIKAQGPSPLSYNPKVQFPNKKFSFPRSSPKKFLTQGPDPGTYNVKFDVLNTTSNYVFTKSERQPLQNKFWMKNVGPGCHQVKYEAIIQQKNQFSFPKTQKFKDDKVQIKEKSIIPGPGKYDIKNARQTHSSIKFALAAKTLQVKEQIPGPGAYKLQGQGSLKNGVKIGRSSRQKDYATETPGPGAYETEVLLKFKSKEAPQTIFPKSPRMRSSSCSVEVGPGKYDVSKGLQNIAKRSKAFTIAAKINKQKIEKTPGPQSYNPDFTKVFQSSERSVFDKSRKTSFSFNKTPGPGAYQLNQKPFAKTFYFNKANQRSDNNKTQNKVGPGQYRIKPFFGQFDGKDKLRVKTQTIYV